MFQNGRLKADPIWPAESHCTPPRRRLRCFKLSRHNQSDLVPCLLPSILNSMKINLVRSRDCQFFQDQLLSFRNPFLRSNEADFSGILLGICLRSDDDFTTSRPLHVFDELEVLVCKHFDEGGAAAKTIIYGRTNTIIFWVRSKTDETKIRLLALPHVDLSRLPLSMLNVPHIPQ